MDKAGTWDTEVGDIEKEIRARVEVLKHKRRKSLAEQAFATAKLSLMPSAASVNGVAAGDKDNKKKNLLKLQPSSKQKIIERKSLKPAADSPASDNSGRASGILGAEFERRHGLIRVDSSASFDTDGEGLSSRSMGKSPSVSHRDKRTSRLRNSAREGRKSIIPRVASEWELDGDI